MTVSEFSAVVTDIRLESRDGASVRWRMTLDRTEFAVGDVGVLHAVSRGGTRIEVPVLAVVADEAGDIGMWWRSRWPREPTLSAKSRGKNCLGVVLTNSLLTTTPYPPSPPIGKIAKIMHLQRFTAMIVEPNGLVLKCKILLSLFAAS